MQRDLRFYYKVWSKSQNWRETKILQNVLLVEKNIQKVAVAHYETGA